MVEIFHWKNWKIRQKSTQIYRKSYQVKNLEDLCNNIISKYPNSIFESENFHSLPEDALISILKRGDLQLEESKIWEYVIQWGKAKNPNLPISLKEWTSDNFLSLKESLNQCLQQIRYFSISGEDVVEKIYPYQQLLEHQLFSDINIKLITPTKPISSTVLPPRKISNTKLLTRISNIMTNEHAHEISSWIDRKEIPYIENNPYEFKLLVRGSRDGFDVKTIYNICDKVSNTVIILNVKGTREVLGGFNPLEWDNNNDEWKRTEDSFVFSLKTANMKNSILSRVDVDGSAIYNFPNQLELCFSVALCLREISSWIDKKETPYIENNPYEFKLLVRGNRDGFDVKTICDICDKVPNTVFILRVEGTEEILGGINPLELDNSNNRWKKSKHSFVFSLKTANMKNSILSRIVKNFDYAIYNYPKDLEFCFGNALCLKGNLKTERKNFCMVNLSYPKLIRSCEFISPKLNHFSNISQETLFSVKELEVFEIRLRNG
ncbi:hypothetical protein Glove_256g160 [Diversispora epigaea]|uniref:TLDc domain-containing protein n=1 Tax=Diversispora epigaea TaxID=1348612 RepID=A0A397I751_9GLOM|nr:hypothetical protein Glove_256g160 [Diversispora epigaea]